MKYFPWHCHCPATEGRPLRPTYEAVGDGGEETNEVNAADRLVFTRISVGATEPVFIVSEIVQSRETEVRRATTERLSASAFRLPQFHTPPGQNEQSSPPSDWDSILAAYRSTKQRAIRATFEEQKATSAHRRTGSPPLHGDRLGVRTTTEPAEGRQQQGAGRASRSPSPSTSQLLSAAQQYLQALRENTSPPRELHEAWEAFYRAYDPLVRRTVAACSLHRADADDCVQEAWAEIAAKLTRFEYDPNCGSFDSWLRIVVHRAACRHARRDHRQTSGRIDEDLSAVKCPRLLGPATTSQREELRASVRETLDAFRASVSGTAFRILVMTAIDGGTSIEIGKLLGLSPGHVRVSRHRTAKKFRQFVAARPALAEAFGVAPSTNEPAEISGNRYPDKQAEISGKRPELL